MTYWFLLAICAACLVVAVLAAWLSVSDVGDALAVCGLILAVLSGLGAMGTGIGFFAYNADRAACLEKEEKTGIPAQYSLLSGCYVRVDGRLIPYDRWAQVSGVSAP